MTKVSKNARIHDMIITAQFVAVAISRQIRLKLFRLVEVEEIGRMATATPWSPLVLP